MKHNHCKSKYSESWLSNGIVYQIISPKVKKIDLIIAKQLISDRKYAMGGGVGLTLPVYVIVNNAVSVNSEAKNYYKTAEPYENISAIAMLLDNYFAYLTGKLIFAISRPKVPTALFNSEQKALDWLKQFKNLN